MVGQLRRARPGRGSGRTTTASFTDEVAAIVDVERPDPPAPGSGAVLHRPVRQRQVHACPGPDGPSARAGRAQRHQPRRRRRTPKPVRGPDLLQGRPGDQHPAHRLGRGRDLATRWRRGLQPDRPVRRDPPAGARHGRGRRRRVLPRPRRDTRWRSASAATARASTPRPAVARSRSSPASPRPTRSPRTPHVRVDTTGRSIDAALADVLSAVAEAGFVDLAPNHTIPV